MEDEAKDGKVAGDVSGRYSSRTAATHDRK